MTDQPNNQPSCITSEIIIAKTLVYLACPYSDPNPLVREWRFKQVNKAAANFMRGGLHIFSPISHTHPIAVAGALPTGWDFWAEYDRAILASCRQMIVMQLPGWRESEGVKAEMKIAEEFGIPVVMMEWGGSDFHADPKTGWNEHAS